jgi:TIR domain
MKVFFSYAHKDASFRENLEVHLAMLKHQGFIETWHDRKISAGDDLDLQINAHLNAADIILFLVSPDFLASPYCYGIEVKRAMYLHRKGRARVIPVILRPCEWQHAPFGRLSAVPRDGKPIRLWADKDSAFLDIARSIRQAIEGMNSRKARPEQQKEKMPPRSTAEHSPQFSTQTSSRYRSSPASSLKERVLVQLWRLLELSCDMYRNMDDETFATSGGQIEYVFDENIFEMFVRPKRHANFVSTFYSSLWPQAKSAHEQQRLSRQTALVTAEHLLSGNLVGQFGKRLHMTHWHFEEFGRRVFLIEKSIPAADKLFLSTETYLDQLRELSTLEIDKWVNNDAKNMVDDEIYEDLMALKKEGVGRESLGRYLWTRVAVKLLSDDDGIESLRQLRRIFLGGLIGRITPLGSPEEYSAKDRLKISHEAEQWMARLQSEIQIRGSQLPASRSKSALRNDAYSLALVLHEAERRIETGQRMLFVTGDVLMFDAYRRWYTANTLTCPFVLRRISQFVPTLRLDTSHEIPRHRLRYVLEALDLAMAPFNLQKNAEGDLNQLLSAREHLALKLADFSRNRASSDRQVEGIFLERLTDDWLYRRAQDFFELYEMWQHLERAVLGEPYDLIKERLSDLPDMAFGEESAAEILGWLSKLLEDITESARRVADASAPSRGYKNGWGAH